MRAGNYLGHLLDLLLHGSDSGVFIRLLVDGPLEHESIHNLIAFLEDQFDLAYGTLLYSVEIRSVDTALLIDHFKFLTLYQILRCSLNLIVLLQRIKMDFKASHVAGGVARCLNLGL